jgi:UDP-3-O-[3-hydroxymyristoyl] glucosamine N-acyltransferase
MKFPYVISAKVLFEGLADFNISQTCELSGIATPENYSSDDLVFVFRNNQFKSINTQPKVLIVDQSVDVSQTNLTYYQISAARFLFQRVLERIENIFLQQNISFQESSRNQTIDPSAKIGKNCIIYPNVVIHRGVELRDNVVLNSGVVVMENTIIEDNVNIHPNTVIYSNCIIRSGSVIYANSVIGMPGFGFELDKGSWKRIPHLSGVIIGKDCFIGSNVCIAAGTIEPTEIGDNVIIDNQVQVAHHVKIGAHTAIAACVGIAGSTTIGKYCLIGGGSGIGGHLTIVDKVSITGMSMVIKSITESGTYSSGMPAEDNATWKRKVAYLAKIPKLFKDIYQRKEFINHE